MFLELFLHTDHDEPE